MIYSAKTPKRKQRIDFFGYTKDIAGFLNKHPRAPTRHDREGGDPLF